MYECYIFISARTDQSLLAYFSFEKVQNFGFLELQVCIMEIVNVMLVNSRACHATWNGGRPPDRGSRADPSCTLSLPREIKRQTTHIGFVRWVFAHVTLDRDEGKNEHSGQRRYLHGDQGDVLQIPLPRPHR
jgi:hypothetical protein